MHLGDETHPDRHERQVLAGVPPAAAGARLRSPAPLLVVPPSHSAHSRHGWPSSASCGQRFEFGEQLGPAGDAERRRHADGVHVAVVVEQAEQQRPDALAVLVDAVAGDGTVGGALVLHLDQRPLAGLVGARRAAWRSRRRARRPRTVRTTRRRRPAIGARRGEVHRVVDVDQRSRAGPAVPTSARRATTGRRRRARRTRRTRRASPRPAGRPATWPGGSAAGARRSRGRCPPVSATTISPSITHRAGRAREERFEQLGEVAGERAQLAAEELDAGRRRGTRCSGSRPTSVRTANRRRRGSIGRAWPASARSVAAAGDRTARRQVRRGIGEPSHPSSPMATDGCVDGTSHATTSDPSRSAATN